MVRAAAAAAQARAARAGRAFVRRSRGRALWPLHPSRRVAFGLCVGACRVAGRDARRRGVDQSLAPNLARHAFAADARHRHRPRRRCPLAASGRCAGVAALGHARCGPAFLAPFQTPRRRADRNRSLAQSGAAMPKARRTPGLGQCPHERAVHPQGAALACFDPTGLPSAACGLAANPGRCRALATAGRREPSGDGQYQVRCAARCRAVRTRPSLARCHAAPGGHAGQFA